VQARTTARAAPQSTALARATVGQRAEPAGATALPPAN